MSWFGQGKDTIEWKEFRDDVMFYKWPKDEIKKGSKLIIRPGQCAIFYANGVIEGVFKDSGSYDIVSEIVPFLSTLKGFFSLRGDSGMRAEVYFVNSKQLLIPWGTRQRIMMPSPQVPSGIPIGCNGNLIIEFRDYLSFINKIAGVKATYTLSDISERIMGIINPIIAECMLNGEQSMALNTLFALQANSRALGKKIGEEIDKELLDIGLGVADFDILSINYPKELAAMAEKVAGQSFVTDVGKYAAVSLADSFGNQGGAGVGGMAAEMAMGMQLAQQMTQGMANNQNANAGQSAAPADAKFCTQCRKMVSSNFCPDCGTKTV